MEDFFDQTSTSPMSSIPVQFLIYVMPEPVCTTPPVIFPLEECLEVPVGVQKRFNITILNLCDPKDTRIDDLVITKTINGLQVGNLTISSIYATLSHVSFAWTPLINQIGSQELCMIVYTR